MVVIDELFDHLNTLRIHSNPSQYSQARKLIFRFSKGANEVGFRWHLGSRARGVHCMETVDLCKAPEK